MSIVVWAEPEDVLREVNKLERAVSGPSMRIFLRMKAWPFLQARTRARFRNEGDDAAGKWAELTLATRRIRGSQGYGPAHPINVRTGQLRDFVTSAHRITGSGRGGVTLTVPGNSGSRVVQEKLSRAQLGGGGKAGRRGPNRPAPARPVLALNETDERAISGSLMTWIRNGGL